LRPSGLTATEFGASRPIASPQPCEPLALPTSPATQPALPFGWVSAPVARERSKTAIASAPEAAT
jgi:hypothetical protein